MSNPAVSFVWYELMTPDPDGAKAFYDAVVGWDIEPAPAGEMDYRMIRRGSGGNAGGVLRITDEMAGGGARPGWLGYLSVHDVDQVAATVLGEGGQIHMPPMDMPGVGRMAMIADPTGAPFYIINPAPPASDPGAASDVFSPDKPQHVRWNELSSSDPNAAMRFYTRHFGWSPGGEMDMGEYGTYRFLNQGETMIGAIMPTMPGKTGSFWSYYIGVDDIDRAAQAVTDLSGTMVQDPIEIPGGEYSLVATDPQGAVFGLVGPRRPSQGAAQ